MLPETDKGRVRYGSPEIGARLKELIQGLAPARTLGSSELDEYAERIMLFTNVGLAEEYTQGHLASRADSIAAIRRFCSQCFKMRQMIWAMPVNVGWALERQAETSLSEIDSELVRIAADLCKAACDVGDHKPKAGRPSKHGAAEAVSKAASVYSMVTGLKPTLSVPVDGGKAGGPFLTFITEIFAALHLRASPEAAIRAYMEKSRTDESP